MINPISMTRKEHLFDSFFPEACFGGFSRLDGTLAFYARVQALLKPDITAVDFGCGRGAYQDDPVPMRRQMRVLKGKVARVIGIDVSRAGEQNPFLDEFRMLEDDRWPLSDASVGLVVSDQVLEHLPDPPAFFAEARRVLVPGGMLCLRTPNRWSYVALASRLVPDRAHTQVLARVKGPIGEQDVFPTLYRCNTIPAIRKALSENSFQHAVYGYAPEPSYLAFSSITYRLGLWYGQLAPEWFKPVIFAFAQAC